MRVFDKKMNVLLVAAGAVLMCFILYALQNPGQYEFLSWLGYVTAIKWLLALAIGGSWLWLLSRSVLSRFGRA